MKILVLCTGNSCRSQIVEGWLKSMEPTWTLRSAGTKPAQAVHPLAIKVMNEIGISIEAHRPKSVTTFLHEPWDLVITVCGEAQESCPSFSGKVAKQLHIGFEDPDKFSGTTKEVMAGFVKVRDQIKTACQNLVNQENNQQFSKKRNP